MARFVKCAVIALLLGSSSASSQVMLGAYVPGDGFSREEISSFNSVMPKSLAFVNLFSAFSHDWDNLYWQTSNIVAEGAMPHISWMPVDLDRPDANLLPEITSGLHDEYIDEWGDRLLAWVAQYPEESSPKILLRFGHEFNADWYAYGNSPFHFQSAWQYIHDKFEETGVNNHVEWVWSANNISVDDFNDITVYYPGAKYVDWTSIDGYNFGTNYSWSNWESFSALYADTYLTLVDNYPEKPILIAEVGSAEESDIPDPAMGQYGDNSDGHQSKDLWVADFLQELNASFPAVRAIAWFNTNKELGWSITQEANTGISSYINGTGSDYFTSQFLSSNGPVTEIDEPVTSDADVERAQADYDEAQRQYQIAKAQLEQHETEHNIAEQQRLESDQSRINASNKVDSTWKAYLQSRVEFYEARDEYKSARENYLHEQNMVAKHWEQYLIGHGEYLDAQEKRNEGYMSILPLRTEYNNSKLALEYASTNLAETELLTEDNSDLEQAEIDNLVSEAKEANSVAQFDFNTARGNLLAIYAAYTVLSVNAEEKYEARTILLSQYQDTVNARTAAKNSFLSAADAQTSAKNQFTTDRITFLEARDELTAAKQTYESSTENANLAAATYEESLVRYDRVSLLRTEAYNALVDAQQRASMASQAQSSGLLLSDQPDVIQTFLTTLIESIDSSSQMQLAMSRKPLPTAPGKLLKRRAKLLKMPGAEKSVLKRSKLSTLDY